MYGITIAAKILGGLLGLANLRSDYHENWRPFTPTKAQEVKYLLFAIGFAVLGAAIGVAADLAINGLSSRGAWRFSMRMLMLAVAACAFFCFGLRCVWEILRTKP